MTCCINEMDLCLIRGTSWPLDVGLAEGFEEVVEAPANYEGRLVFRLDQDDALPELLAQTATVELTGAAAPCSVAFLRFNLTPAQTGDLPPYDLVHFVELREIAGDQRVARLFQGKLDISD